MTSKIKGGYYLKAKCVQESWIAKAPPHIREIWDLFLRKAFYKDGDNLKRGQLLITYSEIIEQLAWFVGYRKMTYKKHHCEIAMKALVKAAMITTTKTTRGVIVTIVNYSKYQDFENYECYTNKTPETTGKLQPTDTIEKEVKEVKEETDNVGQEPRQHIPFKEIIDFFNETTGKSYKHSTNGTKSNIRARFIEGFTLEDFKTVIRSKYYEWNNNPDMEQYIRPQTLFGTKFESYLQAAKERSQPKSKWVKNELFKSTDVPN